MRVFVTGGAGFIGRYVVRELLEKGYDVTCLVREQTNLKDMPKGIQFVFGDITKKDTLKGLNEGMDYVVHLAAMGHVSAVSEAAYQQFVSINEEGTRNLIEEFRQSGQLKKFVQFSSTAAMGPIGLPVLDENSKPNPLTPYQKSKYRSECVMREAFEKFSFPSVVVRPCMVYGPGGPGGIPQILPADEKGDFPKSGKREKPHAAGACAGYRPGSCGRYGARQAGADISARLLFLYPYGRDAQLYYGRAAGKGAVSLYSGLGRALRGKMSGGALPGFG